MSVARRLPSKGDARRTNPSQSSLKRIGVSADIVCAPDSTWVEVLGRSCSRHLPWARESSHGLAANSTIPIEVVPDVVANVVIDVVLIKEAHLLFDGSIAGVARVVLVARVAGLAIIPVVFT